VKTTRLPFFIWVSSVVAAVPALEAAELEAGVAVADITSPIGYRMCGYFYERLSTGVHDPLHAKAIYLHQDKQQAALVFCDLIGVPQTVTDQARAIATRKTGIPSTNILVAATHSHTGPLYFDALRTFLHERAVEKNGSDPQETIDYPSALAEKLAGAIVQAKAAGKPVELAAGIAKQTGLSFNRRFHMKDGTVVFNPGKLNPNIVCAAGPIDPDVGFVLFRNRGQRQAFALLTVFALHLDTTGGTEYSADYPFHLERSARAKLGDDFISIFGAGTCGDINHIDVSTNRSQKSGEESQRIGKTLGETVVIALPELKTANKPSLAVRFTKVFAPLQEFSEEQIERARERMARFGSKELSFLDQVEAYKILDVQEMSARFGRMLPMEVQAFRLDDDTILVGLPGEVFVELGLAIKQASPFRNTLVVELCNNDIGYVPTKKAFVEGSYEVVNSRVQSGGGEMLVEAAARLLKELKR
jgi:neutral ceramidase